MAATAELEPAKKRKALKQTKNGVAQIFRFKPVEKAEHLKAFAISLEREGGVPKKEGPILLVGSAWHSSYSFFA
jgi:hypothetical protein